MTAVKILRRTVLALLAAALIYLLCTPIGALRLAIFPWVTESAVSLHIRDAFDPQMQSAARERAPLFTTVYCFDISQAPRGKVTGNPMITWNVYHIGPLCWAMYRGEA